jgi:hypothetical protein
MLLLLLLLIFGLVVVMSGCAVERDDDELIWSLDGFVNSILTSVCSSVLPSLRISA